MRPLFRLSDAFILLCPAAALSAQTNPSRSEVQNSNDVQITVPVNKTVGLALGQFGLAKLAPLQNRTR